MGGWLIGWSIGWLVSSGWLVERCDAQWLISVRLSTIVWGNGKFLKDIHVQGKRNQKPKTNEEKGKETTKNKHKKTRQNTNNIPQKKANHTTQKMWIKRMSRGRSSYARHKTAEGEKKR